MINNDQPAMPDPKIGDSGDRLLSHLRSLATEWDAADAEETFPAARLRLLGHAGALSAFTALTDRRAVDRLRIALRLIGGADLSLGRLFEGHVNAVQLVGAYGDRAQQAALSQDLIATCVFGVWNTEPAPGVSIEAKGGRYRLIGAKSFATGAGHIDRALITARRADGRKQMVLVDIGGSPDRANNRGWRVRGMRGTCSGTFDFTDMIVDDQALIGAPEDYEREPRFSGGAWRFTAVQLGAVEALVRHWRNHLTLTGRGADPIQRVRFAAGVAAARSASTWVTHASRRAEAEAPDAIPLVLMTRGIVEDAGLAVMEGAARAVGTAAFFTGNRIDRITRDLGLYLRQPVPDQARDRAAAAWLQADCWGEDPWW